MRRLFFVLLSLSLFLGPLGTVRAQGQATVDLYPPDLSAFPTVSALLDVYDERGVFVTGLTADAISVTEDGQAQPATELVEQFLPAQLVVAVNSGPALDVRDGQGISRFQRLVQVLDGWAQGLPAENADDLSLVSISGPVISHASPQDFRNSLQAFQPDFRNTTPNLQSLALALDVAGMQTPRPGMKRAILLITPHMDDPDISAAIQPLIDRAVQEKVRVFVWFVDLDAYFVTTSAAAFNTLAVQSGGSLFAYSGVEPFPNPESYFAPLRRTYTLKYASAVTAGGDHTLSVDVQLPAGKLSSAPQTFSLDLQPPNPILVSPPAQITRQAPPEDPFNNKLLLPEQQVLKIIIEFPDGHPRPLVRTTLYVDGQIADENTSEPFDTFQWDLKGYELSGEHQMLVEAVDSVGLSKTSMAIPVTLTVVQPPRGLIGLLTRFRLPIIIGAVALAGLALVFVLFTGRLRLPSLRARREARKVLEDPLTQPVAAVVEPPTGPGQKVKRRREPLPVRTRLAETRASLVPILPDGQPATGNPIPLG